MQWIERHRFLTLVASFGPVLLGWAFIIGRESGNFNRALLFFVGAGLLWVVFTRFLIIPLARRIDVAVKETALRSVKSLLFGAVAALTVLAIWMVCLIGTYSAYLGGPQFSSLPCSLFTSFTLTHVLGGMLVVLPFGAIAGVFHLADGRSRRVEISSGVRDGIRVTD